MPPRVILLLSCVTLSNFLNAQNFNSRTYGGEILGIILGVIALIFVGIKMAYKKVDKKIDNYKLSRNPQDIKTNEKRLLQNLEQDKFPDTISIATALYEIDPNNFLGASITGIRNHEEKLYTVLQNLCLHKHFTILRAVRIVSYYLDILISIARNKWINK